MSPGRIGPPGSTAIAELRTVLQGPGRRSCTCTTSVTVRPCVGLLPLFSIVISPVTVIVGAPSIVRQPALAVFLTFSLTLAARGSVRGSGQVKPAEGTSATTSPNWVTRSVFVGAGAVVVVTVTAPAAGTVSVAVCAGSSTTAQVNSTGKSFSLSTVQARVAAASGVHVWATSSDW